MATLLLVALGTRLRAATAPEAPDPGKSHALRVRQLPGGMPGAVNPTLSIPVAPLGYTPPAAIYIGQRNSLASLDFVDENRLLFTFRVPGLLRRSAEDKLQQGEHSEARQIRALVLHLPSGSIDTEAVWTVRDRARYLWMLRDGNFLLRDGDTVLQGDDNLELKPVLHLPGPVLWLELDPEEQNIVTSSRELEKPKPGAIHHATDDLEPDTRPNIVLRVVRRSTGKVMAESRVRSLLHLPFNSEGYVEALRGRGTGWVLNLNSFSGGSRMLGQMESTCMPRIDFLAPTSMLTTGCGVNGARRLSGMSTTGELQWIDEANQASIWPETIHAANGTRLATETMEATHAISATAPLDPAEVKGQAVRVLDAQSGELLLETSASPVYDAGGNVALSPSGRRLAVLNKGALEIYDLPVAAATASPAARQKP